MAFRTNKVPAIEERTVSGSSVSFNSAFALPLKACKVSFSATQAGSGDPSPSNPRAISGVSSIGLTANSTPVSVSLGDTRYGGELDVLTGELTVTHSIIELDGSNDEVYTVYSSYNGFTLYVASAKSGTNMPCMCNWLKTQVGYSEFGLRIGADSSRFYFLHITDNISGVSDIVSWRAYLGEHPLEIVFELAEPAIIQLSANELSSILGNNTFSTDTGTLEITFADLQEKSASGAVATFNTALAMPLASCNIAVNAWQEGSGDPSPVNVRPIHGFSEVNAYQRVVNLWDEQWKQGAINTSGGINKFETSRRTTSFIAVVPNTTYRQVSPQNAYGGRIAYYDKNQTLLSYDGNGVSGGTHTFTTPDNCHYVRITVGSGYGTTYNNNISINYPSTDTNYHAYTGNTYTIQLGQEVYGAEVDVVNGVAHVTHNYATTYNRDLNITQYDFQNRHGIAINQMLPTTAIRASGICNMSVVNNSNLWIGVNNITVYWLDILDTLDMTLNEFKEWLIDHPLEVAYQMRESDIFDIQLTPQQIETLIGNNTIFADTGDVDLTFKDLDIAKRGNFREVFKLPS